jgi:trk system potassium uptake protein TrkA
MRVVICGAGRVGYNIAAYLARENNDITVIDTDPKLIARINEELDANGIVGPASRPDILEKAGANDADILIAVTPFDEINMIACQVAHSIFSVPKKIARIHDLEYLDPAWSNLFSRAHLPIDVIISPEAEVARAINSRLEIPGTTSVMALADAKVYLLGVICPELCPIINTPLRQLVMLFPDLAIEIAAISRNNKIIFPGPDDQMLAGDEVFFFADSKHLRRAMSAFGHEEDEARNIVIVGGGNIGMHLADMLDEQGRNIRVKIIERNPERAAKLSELLPNNIILNGDALRHEIMMEANVAQAETLIAVTDDDEANILVSLLAKQQGCKRVITLIDKPNYAPLISHLGIDAAVSPGFSTVSTIMQHVRRGRIRALLSIANGELEVIEVEMSENSAFVNIALIDLEIPDHVVIGAIVRNKEVIMPKPFTIIKPGDHVMIMAPESQMPQVEKLFIAQLDLF